MHPDLLIAVVVAVLFLGALSRCTIGFGDALIAMPLLTMTLGLQTAAPLVALLSLTVAAALLTRDWPDIDLASAWRLVVPGLAGMFAGMLLLGAGSPHVLIAVLAVIVVGFSAYALLRPRLPELHSERTAPLFGLLAGLLGGAYNTHGPPLVIYGAMRRFEPARFRATLQGYFVPAAAAVVAMHAVWERIDYTVIGYYLCSLPAIALSLPIGRALNRRFKTETFVRYVYAVLMVIGLALLLRTVDAWRAG